MQATRCLTRFCNFSPPRFLERTSVSLPNVLAHGSPRGLMTRSGVFDSYSFFTDMLNNPAQYLNGTAPPNITGAIHSCVFALNEDTSDSGNCTTVTGAAADSYFWSVLFQEQYR